MAHLLLVPTILEGGIGPLVVNYRVSAGALPPSHWYHDRRQGCRLLGEACHFVDTCAAIVGSDASAGHPASEKERIEVLGRGRSATIIDFRAVVLNGRPRRRHNPQDKGHLAEVRAFRQAVLSGENRSANSAIASTRTTLQVAAVLIDRGSQVPATT